MKKAILILSVLTITCSLALTACGGDEAVRESAAPDSVQDGNPAASRTEGTQTRYTGENPGSDETGHSGSDSDAEGTGHNGSVTDAEGTGHNGSVTDADGTEPDGSVTDADGTGQIGSDADGSGTGHSGSDSDADGTGQIGLDADGSETGHSGSVTNADGTGHSGSGTDADGTGHNAPVTDADETGHSGSGTAADGKGPNGSDSDAAETTRNGTAPDTVPGADTLPGTALDSVMDQLRTEIDLSGNLSFSAQTAFGDPIDSSVFSGYDLTMINIWGTLCKPCIEEMPDLQKLYEDMAAEGVNIIGFVANYQEDRVEKAQEILTAKGITYSNVVFDDETSGIIAAQISGFPTTIFVDSQGNVIGEQISGARGYDEYKDIINERLEECASWQE